ncbi:helix-turn-helix domain-containing protein [Clostridium haemolyticum]|nr:helix-turn-helix domain-containing protein [Clostridium haemolyticum]
MRELTWAEYCKEYQESQKHLRSLIKRLYKTPNNSVSDNTVHIVERELEKSSTFSIEDITINVKKENVEVLYNCDDIEEIKEMEENYNIKEINDLDIILNCDIESFEIVFNNILGDILTSNEASEMYGVAEGTIRSAMKTGKLKYGTDYRKAGRITLIRKEAMEREYGTN